MDAVVGAVLVDDGADLVVAGLDLGDLNVLQDLHVGQAFQLALQHGVGTQFRHELEERDMVHHASQVDGGLDTRVATADDGDALALEERAVAVRAVGDAAVAVFLLAGHAHAAPPGTGSQDDGPALEAGAAGGLDGDHAGSLVTADRLDLLQVHDVDTVVTGVGLQGGGKLGTVGFQHRDVVLDGHGVQHLAAETLGHHAGADALAGGVDGCRSTGRAAADDQHVERILLGELLGGTGVGTAVQARQDLFGAGAALEQHFAVQEDGGHGHDGAFFHFVLEEGAVDGLDADAGVDDRHRIERLHHVRAVLARQRHVDLEVVVAGQGLGLLDGVGVELDGVAADVQQGQHQRGELVAQRDGGKAHADVGADAVDGEGGLADIRGRVFAQGDLVGQLGDFLQEFLHLFRFRTAVQGGHQLDRLFQVAQVGLQLVLEVCVKHDGAVVTLEMDKKRPATGCRREELGDRSAAWPGLAGNDVNHDGKAGSGLRPASLPGCGIRSCRPGPARASGSRRLLSTWRGRLRPGARPRTGQP